MAVEDRKIQIVGTGGGQVKRAASVDCRICRDAKIGTVIIDGLCLSCWAKQELRKPTGPTFIEFGWGDKRFMVAVDTIDGVAASWTTENGEKKEISRVTINGKEHIVLETYKDIREMIIKAEGKVLRVEREMPVDEGKSDV